MVPDLLQAKGSTPMLRKPDKSAQVNQTSQSNAEKSSPPVFKTKCGRVHIAVFEQPTSQGSMLSVTLKRVYKAESGEFRDAYSFALSDLDDISRAFADVKAWAE